ncbi:MAG: chemotaxis protein CheW [Deferrisomatales bacterium]
MDQPHDMPQALCTFSVDGAWFGIDLLQVQEVSRQTAVSPAPLAPPHVLGVMNLRGRVVTVLDLGRALGLAPTALTAETRNVIVQSRGELVALLVDQVGDVVEPGAADWSPAPGNLQGLRPECLRGVARTAEGLIGVLAVDETLRDAP